MLFYSKRSCALPTFKNALRLKQQQTCEMIPMGRTTVIGEHMGGPRAMLIGIIASLRKVKS